MKNGFSLMELMITVAIIGILSLIAYPAYKNYVLRVHISQLVSTGIYFMKQYQEFSILGDISSAPNLQEIYKEIGAESFQKYPSRCSQGYENWQVFRIPKNKVALLGFEPKYVRTISIIGPVDIPCAVNNGDIRSHPGMQSLIISLDIEKMFGIKYQWGGGAITRLDLTIMTSQVVLYSADNTTRNEGSIFTTCAFRANIGLTLPPEYPISALPVPCRYILHSDYYYGPRLLPMKL